MTMPAQLSPRVAALLKKTRATRGRLIFALDATASREPTWDMASQLQASMFEEAAKIGGLDVQLVYYRGIDEVTATPWLSDAHDLVTRMSSIRCAAGNTKIERVLHHIHNEHACEKISAGIFIGDACEEPSIKLYDVAATLSVPLFLFQEGDGNAGYPGELQAVEGVFRKIAQLTGGAYGKFDAGAAKQLGELLRAVAAFAVGGITALTNQHTETARKLLIQMR